MDQLKAMRYFVKVAEAGSFTKAAQHFDVPASSLSRRVADLENHLGAVLLKRSTRVVRLTEIGRLYLQQVRDILSRLEATDELVGSYQSKPMGHLKISATVGFGETLLLPLMDEFSDRYPEIVLDIELSDALSTLGRDDVDIAIRGGYVPDERVVAVKLRDNRFILAGSPAYLEREGMPAHAQDLKEHKGLFYRAPIGILPWISMINDEWQDVSPHKVAVSNAGRWLVDKASKGDGLLMLPRWALQSALDRGALLEIPLNPAVAVTRSEKLGIYLLYAQNRYQVPKVKAAVDFLVTRLFDHPD
ncbi:LysR family transcriptional regulator [Oceanospirillum linum]|uniref:LysR family transcriptional regulator n=1 Tax=Oceanospirillum linum TaxID=966 RepID=A0A1T1HAR5_OCELI|nr:LysR family transcriptional regulator [Oceanospirillum linum]OOV86866.1 LysR family transcriptional regulator [Oceanospirillum linum]SEG20447.1 DNA-binding transcriptional regulator, LysR family [Oleiphilus messinensis]SMP24436.1 transcriptional regulator, LysR family [Oceanospirillum linum]